MEMQSRIGEYVELLSELRQQGLEEQTAIAVLEQVGKDKRAAMISRERGNGNGFGQASKGVVNGDVPATEKQLNYLKVLGVDTDEGLTKQQASNLIDEHSA